MSVASHRVAAKNGLGMTQLATFEHDGLVKADYRLDTDRREHLLDLTERTLGALPGMRPESINCPHAPGWIDGLPNSISAEWLAAAGWAEILDRVVSLIGDDVILWGSQLFCKPAGDGLEVPWHQDGEYWPIEPLNTCSVWLAIDDATVENGCMRYIPGSHKARRVVPHQLDARENLALNQSADPDHFDVTAAADDVLLAGEFSLHDVYLIHGSNANRSTRRRAGLVWRFMSSRSFWNRDTALGNGSAHFKTRFDERPLFLMRGQAHANKILISRHPAHQT